MLKISILFTGAILLSGCGFSFAKPTKYVEPVKDITELHDVCVYKNIETFMTYNEAEKIITTKLDDLKISYELKNKEDLKNCQYLLAYNIRRDVGIPTYLSIMEVTLSNEKNVLGSIQYYYSLSGLSVSAESMKSTDKIILSLLNEMFVQQ